jgi:hypothetical protein
MTDSIPQLVARDEKAIIIDSSYQMTVGIHLEWTYILKPLKSK